MPFEVDGERSRMGPRIEVCPSAVLELTWVMNLLWWSEGPEEVPEVRPLAPQLREELLACWGDESKCLPDTSILAERAGALLTDEADSFLDGLERAAGLDGAGLELRSETTEVREATLRRLDRFRREPERTRRYAEVLAIRPMSLQGSCGFPVLRSTEPRRFGLVGMCASPRGSAHRSQPTPRGP